MRRALVIMAATLALQVGCGRQEEPSTAASSALAPAAAPPDLELPPAARERFDIDGGSSTFEPPTAADLPTMNARAVRRVMERVQLGHPALTDETDGNVVYGVFVFRGDSRETRTPAYHWTVPGRTCRRSLPAGVKVDPNYACDVHVFGDSRTGKSLLLAERPAGT